MIFPPHNKLLESTSWIAYLEVEICRTSAYWINTISHEENNALVALLSDMLSRVQTRKLIITEPKTVSELLIELDLSENHVVLIDGKRVELDYLIQENESVVVLPRIAGG